MKNDLMSGYDLRGTAETGLTKEYAWNVGKALADWLPTTGKIIVVWGGAQDELAQAVIEGLRLQGRDVLNGGSGDKNVVMTRINADGLSGGVVVGFDSLEKLVTIELYQHEAKLIESETGLAEIVSLVEAGNFVPAAVKGELSALA